MRHFTTYLYRIIFLIIFLSASVRTYGTVFEVDSQVSFESALNAVTANDTIAWKDGTYQNIYMNIQKSNLVVLAVNPGEVVFTGGSWAAVKGNYVTISGLQFIDGDIGTKNVLESYGSYNHFDNLNIDGYTSYKYLVIRAECQYNKVTFCNFENRLNLDDKNILSVLVDATNPGYNLIQYCSFKNFDGVGQDMGIEPIRIGLSTQGEFVSRTVVEYCYFTQCNGDGEIISNKARQNVFRYNTFEDNPVAELTLRHGDEGVVYGNFFLNGMGGVRIKEGQNHVVYNNYFSGLTKYSLTLQNYGVDPLDNVLIAYNTFVETDVIRLGGAGSYPPQNVTFANNIIVREEGNLFYDPTNTEEWIGNIISGSLGISGDPGLINKDPKLEMNSQGYYGPVSTSPIIDAAQEGYPSLPEYDGLDIDTEIILDLMKGSRPSLITEKDVGATEYSDTGFVQPHVTDQNTGPSYLRKKITLSVDPQGHGSIEVEPQQDEYEIGTVVTITALPTEGYEFSSWSGDKVSITSPDTVIMNSSRLIYANFKLVTGWDDSITESELELYPNPVKDKFNLSETHMMTSSDKIYLYDYKGRLIKLLNDLDRSRSFDISNLPSGMYFLAIVEDKETTSSSLPRRIKLIKE